MWTMMVPTRTGERTHTHTHVHARTRTRTHAPTHTHTHTQAGVADKSCRTHSVKNAMRVAVVNTGEKHVHVALHMWRRQGLLLRLEDVCKITGHKFEAEHDAHAGGKDVVQLHNVLMAELAQAANFTNHLRRNAIIQSGQKHLFQSHFFPTLNMHPQEHDPVGPLSYSLFNPVLLHH